jgi:lipopolysaccharide export LptBFGC system permease protein LptF
MSPYRVFCVLGFVVYLLFFLLLEKITGITFISDMFSFSIMVIIWIIICIVIGVKKSKEKDDEYFKF